MALIEGASSAAAGTWIGNANSSPPRTRHNARCVSLSLFMAASRKTHRTQTKDNSYEQFFLSRLGAVAPIKADAIRPAPVSLCSVAKLGRPLVRPTHLRH